MITLSTNNDQNSDPTTSLASSQRMSDYDHPERKSHQNSDPTTSLASSLRMSDYDHPNNKSEHKPRQQQFQAQASIKTSPSTSLDNIKYEHKALASSPRMRENDNP